MEDTSEMLGFVLHGANMAALTLLQWSTGIHLEHTNTVLLGDAWMRFIVSIRTQIHYYNYNLYTEYYTIIYIIFILYLYYNLYNYNFTQNLSSFLRSDLFPPPKPEVIGLIHTFQLLVLSHNNSPSLSWIILDSLSIHKQRIEKKNEKNFSSSSIPVGKQLSAVRDLISARLKPQSVFLGRLLVVIKCDITLLKIHHMSLPASHEFHTCHTKYHLALFLHSPTIFQ